MSEASVGHNSVAADLIISVIERAEMLIEEKKAVAESLKEVFAEAKGNGLSVSTIKELIKLRAMDPADREERAAILELYRDAIGGI